MSTEGPLWPEGFDRIVLDEIDSTNAEAARLAPGLVRPTWILAKRQTNGRGRRGRIWHNPEGNFAATLLMRPGGAAQEAALRSFLAANALFETLAMLTERTRLATKWPNDVLLDGGKVAGILLESTGRSGEVDWLSIGIGVNLKTSPMPDPEAAFLPVALAEQGIEAPSPEQFLEVLAGHYATEEAIFGRLGFLPIREAWLRHAAKLGEVITARTAREEMTGTFETVDEVGNLVLKTAKGRSVIAAADVYF
ncbi:MAG: biotin--[acetyl-CoA-carboxylase] ligase [Rhodobacteraceae bacterium]|nr:biotin--[acetyl-CoA-carboxylase] ligase [Paracoccaceae bacterium]